MHDLAHVLSNITNPILAVILLFAAVRQSKYPKGVFVIASTVAIAYSVCIAEVGKDVLLYPHPGGFPSGHQTFATATLTCLVWIERRWLQFALPVAVMMAIAIIAARFHAPIDVIGASIISPVTTSATLALFLRPRNLGRVSN